MLKRNVVKSPQGRSRGRKKGQSTIEYIVLVAAVIAAILIFVGSGAFNQGYNSAITGVSNQMNVIGSRLSNSYTLSD